MMVMNKGPGVEENVSICMLVGPIGRFSIAVELNVIINPMEFVFPECEFVNIEIIMNRIFGSFQIVLNYCCYYSGGRRL